MFSTLLTASIFGGRFVFQARLKSLPAIISLPKKTSPVSMLVTTRSRSLTSLIPTTGSPGGSVQARVTRRGWPAAAEATWKKRVCLLPVESALVGLWSNRYIELDELAPVVRFDSTPGNELGSWIWPQPW